MVHTCTNCKLEFEAAEQRELEQAKKENGDLITTSRVFFTCPNCATELPVKRVVALKTDEVIEERVERLETHPELTIPWSEVREESETKPEYPKRKTRKRKESR